MSLIALCVALISSACAGRDTPTQVVPVSEAELRETVGVLAADSLEGRLTGTRGADLAARYIAERLARSGVPPAFPRATAEDSAYFQRIPIASVPLGGGRTRLALLGSWSAIDTIPEARRVSAANVVGVIPGSDPVLRDEVIVFAAHYDHVGVGQPVGGDSIYNGADDNASGVATVLEIGRALANGPPPRRTVLLLLTAGEEVGLLGTRWYLQNPVLPLERTVAQLGVEMVGRPDPLAGGPGRAWLTGFERSTVGESLAAGVPVVADPRPDQLFFQRSDNIGFACRGIPAHTLSSYGMHEDYHTPRDQVERIDFSHMAQVVGSAVAAARMLADGPRPQWRPNGNPASVASICGGF